MTNLASNKMSNWLMEGMGRDDKISKWPNQRITKWANSYIDDGFLNIVNRHYAPSRLKHYVNTCIEHAIFFKFCRWRYVRRGKIKKKGKEVNRKKLNGIQLSILLRANRQISLADVTDNIATCTLHQPYGH